MAQSIWNTVQNEITQNYSLRKPLIQKISKFFEDRYVISFYTMFGSESSITDGDSEMLLNLLMGSKKVKSKKILFLINSPGGDPLASEKIIKLLSEYSDSEYWALVPGTAKSAATMICFGAKKIILSPISELGPIDLQIVRNNKLVPTHSIITAYDKLMEKGINLSNIQQIDPILQQLQGFDASEIEMFRQVNELSSDIAEKVLKNCMMKTTTLKEIKKTINIFLDPTKSKTHGRPIYFSDIEKTDKNKYFNIQCINTENAAWQTIVEYHARATSYLRVTNTAKLLESEDASFSAPREI
jgi:Serine dehydrogenase proteinase